MNERTIRDEMLLGRKAMEKLAGRHVAAFGLGLRLRQVLRLRLRRILFLYDRLKLMRLSLFRAPKVASHVVGDGLIVCVLRRFLQEVSRQVSSSHVHPLVAVSWTRV